MTDPTSAPTPAQERQEARDAEIVGEVVIPFVGALLDIRTAIDTFEARAGIAYGDTANMLRAGIFDAVDVFGRELIDDGLDRYVAGEWRQVLNDPAKTAAWYAGHKAANPRRYPKEGGDER